MNFCFSFVFGFCVFGYSVILQLLIWGRYGLVFYIFHFFIRHSRCSFRFFFLYFTLLSFHSYPFFSNIIHLALSLPGACAFAQRFYSLFSLNDICYKSTIADDIPLFWYYFVAVFFFRRFHFCLVECVRCVRTICPISWIEDVWIVYFISWCIYRFSIVTFAFWIGVRYKVNPESNAFTLRSTKQYHITSTLHPPPSATATTTIETTFTYTHLTIFFAHPRTSNVFAYVSRLEFYINNPQSHTISIRL